MSEIDLRTLASNDDPSRPQRMLHEVMRNVRMHEPYATSAHWLDGAAALARYAIAASVVVIAIGSVAIARMTKPSANAAYSVADAIGVPQDLGTWMQNTTAPAPTSTQHGETP